MRQERQFPKVHLVGSFQGKGERVFFLGVSNRVPLAEMDPRTLYRGSGFPIAAAKHGGCKY